MPNTYLPISISLKDKKVLVVGGGVVALRKIETLMDFESEITVIAPEVGDKISYFAERGSIKLEKREYASPEASSYGLVISASDDNTVNETIYNDCRKAGVLVNVVDNPLLCDFIFPSIILRDCLSVAVASDGKAPFLSGHLKLILENMFPERWKRIANLAAKFRVTVKERCKDEPQRKAESFENFLNSDWKDLLDKEKKNEINLDQAIEDMIEKQVEII